MEVIVVIADVAKEARQGEMKENWSCGGLIELRQGTLHEVGLPNPS